MFSLWKWHYVNNSCIHLLYWAIQHCIFTFSIRLYMVHVQGFACQLSLVLKEKRICLCAFSQSTRFSDQLRWRRSIGYLGARPVWHHPEPSCQLLLLSYLKLPPQSTLWMFSLPLFFSLYRVQSNHWRSWFFQDGVSY